MLLDCDYHIHTTFSDGVKTPEEIVDWYIQRRYSTIAITDHDGVEGSVAAISYAREKAITVIPGIELSTVDEYGNTVHMLGYSFDLENEELQAALFDARMERAKRNDKFLKALREMGYDVCIDDLLEINDGHFVGKPTFARVLVKKGYAQSVKEVFRTVFSRPEISSVKKKHMPSARAISLIHRAGGMAVMAHPMEIRQKNETLETFRPRITNVIERLMDSGVDGIECWHPSATFYDSQWLRDFARARDMTVTGGSDFHSENERRFENED